MYEESDAGDVFTSHSVCYRKRRKNEEIVKENTLVHPFMIKRGDDNEI